jgi:hypothetical protein
VIRRRQKLKLEKLSGVAAEDLPLVLGRKSGLAESVSPLMPQLSRMVKKLKL